MGPERDAAIEAMLPHVPFDGWTRRALARGLAEIGAPADEVELLFPGGAAAMVEAFCDLADRRMSDGAAALDLADQGLTKRVRAVIALRLAQTSPHKEAVRRAVAVLALPMHARQAAGVHGAHGGRDLARRRRSHRGFHLVHQARAAGGGLRRDAAVLAARHQRGRRARPWPFWIAGWPGSEGCSS